MAVVEEAAVFMAETRIQSVVGAVGIMIVGVKHAQTPAIASAIPKS